MSKMERELISLTSLLRAKHFILNTLFDLPTFPWRYSSITFFKNKFIYFYLFLAVLGLRCCAWAFSSCGERGLLFVAVRGFSQRRLLLLRSMGSRCAGFSSCGTRSQ